MKRLRALGLGVKKRQAESIDSSLLKKKTSCGKKGSWVKVIHKLTLLDTCCPVSLWNSFRSPHGQEHRSLKLSQFELQTDEDGSLFLAYIKTHQKITMQGGLSHRKLAKVQEYCMLMRTNLTHSVA